jgi:hypothetical protein
LMVRATPSCAGSEVTLWMERIDLILIAYASKDI